MLDPVRHTMGVTNGHSSIYRIRGSDVALVGCRQPKDLQLCRKFIKLIEDTRQKSYKWMPAETMCYVLAESGYLSFYKVSN